MAETVYSGSVEPDQANTCEGNKRRQFVVSYCNPIYTPLIC